MKLILPCILPLIGEIEGSKRSFIWMFRTISWLWCSWAGWIFALCRIQLLSTVSKFPGNNMYGNQSKCQLHVRSFTVPHLLTVMLTLKASNACMLLRFSIFGNGRPYCFLNYNGFNTHCSKYERAYAIPYGIPSLLNVWG